jgi:hypothetical protein
MSAITGTAVAAKPATRGVPAQFHGDWRVSQKECPPTITERPVWINASRVRLDHSVGEVRVVEEDGKRNLTIAGELLSDGDPWNAKLQLELSESGGELTISEGDWSMKLQRCPSE